MSSSKGLDIHQSLESFINTHPKQDVARLKTYLEDEPEMVPVKYETRATLDRVFLMAKKFQTYQEYSGWSFNDVQLAMWVMMRYGSHQERSLPDDTYVLKYGHVKPGHLDSVAEVRKSLLSIEPCLKHLLRSLAGLPLRGGIPAPKIRGDVERAVVKRDGGACVVMKTADPEAVPILPFGVDLKDMKHTDREAIEHHLATGTGIGTSTQRGYSKVHKQIMTGLKSGPCSWNMISLSPQMRDWWNRMYFELDFRSLVRVKDAAAPTPWKVQMRFRWLPVREKNIDFKEVRLARTTLRPLDLVRRVNGHHIAEKGAPTIAAVIPRSWQPLKTGHIFYVNVETEEDGLKMARLLEMRSCLVEVAHMSNAASVTDELVESYRAEEEEASDTLSDFSYISTPSNSGSESGEKLAVVE